jgi:transposase-like protein
MTRYSQAEKMEIIRLVETSELPVKQTLAELEVPRSTFYDWYRRYVEAGYDGLADRQPQRQQFWNRIPDSVREQVVEVALEKTELEGATLDPDIHAIHWLGFEEIVANSARMRSPLVLASIEQHRRGICYPLDLIYSE